jgi:ectoine hydroxylase-related dioxygenase (phytanoyl-CoA dioxygenase family)
MADERKSYGVTERELDHDVIGSHAERIRLAGYSVLDTSFTAGDVADIAQRLDRLHQRQLDEYGAERLDAIGDRFSVRCPLVDDEAFLSLATFPPMLALVRRLVGDYVVLMQQNGVINPPSQDHTQSAYHRDLPYQHFVSSRPLAVSALFCIDAFTEETGATVVIPGSHHVERFASEGVASSLEVPVTAAPGSFIVFDAMLFHRAGHNRSTRVRRGVNHVFSIPLIAQQISLPAALGGRYSDRPDMRALLGYDAEPAASAAAWRDRRLQRKARAM